MPVARMPASKFAAPKTALLPAPSPTPAVTFLSCAACQAGLTQTMRLAYRRASTHPASRRPSAPNSSEYGRGQRGANGLPSFSGECQPVCCRAGPSMHPNAVCFAAVSRLPTHPARVPNRCSTGWLTHWGEQMSNTSTEVLLKDTQVGAGLASGRIRTCWFGGCRRGSGWVGGGEQRAALLQLLR